MVFPPERHPNRPWDCPDLDKHIDSPNRKDPHADLPWPIDGLAYTIALLGPLCAAIVIGLVVDDGRAAGIGVVTAIGVEVLNVLLVERVLERWIAKHERRLQQGVPRVLANIAAFAWAIVLCVIPVLVSIAVLFGFRDL